MANRSPAKKRGGRRESKTSPRRLAAAERHQKALNMRRDGHTYEEIKTKLGYASPSGAEKAVKAALQSVIREPAEEVRAMELARLDRMLLKLRARINKGDHLAINSALKIQDRRARLLGLDAPVRQEISGADGDPLMVDVGLRETMLAKLGDPDVIKQLDAAASMVHDDE